MGIGLLTASAAAGCFSRCFVHPMDTLRSRLMVSTSHSTTLRTAFRDILKTDGARGLYRGFGISVIMQAPAMGTYLSSYDYFKHYIKTETNFSASSPGVHLTAGLFAETISAVFWVPMEVIKQRAQVRTGGMASASSAVIARDLIAHEGPRALFKGYALTIGVFGPFSMVYFMAYEKCKQIAAKQLRSDPNLTKDLPTNAIAASAAVAGALAAASTTPLDVIKTRLQTQGDAQLRTSGDRAHAAYRGTLHAARVIFAEEGLRGFMKGISARVLWIVPGKIITMSTFEFLKTKFDLLPDADESGDA